MSETQLQFRVGLLVLGATAIAVLLTFQFGGLQRYFQPRYTIAVHFEDAPGLVKGTPVRMNGLPIGSVSQVSLDDRRGGVLAMLEIHQDRKLRKDSKPQLSRSILGDAAVEFSPGISLELIRPGELLTGSPPSDPLEIVHRMEKQVGKALESLTATSDEWQKVAGNINRLVQTKEGSLDDVIEKTATALAALTSTLGTAQATFNQANAVIADPKMLANIQKTVEAVPLLVMEARQTVSDTRAAINETRMAIDIMKAGLVNVKDATQPMADNSKQLVTKLDQSLTQFNNSLTTLQEILKDADVISTMLAEEDGTFKRLATDPQLYANLNNSTAAIAVLMTKLDFILRDVRVFTDKVARHPEVLGVGGALRGSSGLKDENEGLPASSNGTVRETGYETKKPIGLPRFQP